MLCVNFKMMNFLVLLLTCAIAGVIGTEKSCPKGLSTSKLVCYYSTLDEVQGCYCTHVILPASSDFKSVEGLKSRVKGVKVYVTVNEFNQGLIDLLKNTKIDGLEVNLKKLDSKHDISDFISTIKTKIGTDLDIALSVPPKAELLAKYFDFKVLSKHADLFILQTAFLGASENVTFHPSRLSGMWDMQNTDSVVDLVSGLGAPLSKVVITAPVQAYQFSLQNEEYTAPGSPALELKSIDRNELCRIMKANSNWTLERDEDRAGPYIFSKNRWVAFDDPKSMDIKAKYARIRGLAGMALKDLSQDGGSQCGSTILEAAYNGLSTQSRAPRGAVLHSLEREIVDSSAKSLESVQLSPFSISRIIDTEGKIHVVRQDSRTEFKCSRQGYFVHPRSCNRFYRCVKFNQLTDDYNVFEFDCPAGLAFDERVEVCVWPGSLPHGTPCSGSSEIAPVPRGRFECPSEPGYYADPENCRWFFACLDHGKSSLTPYEFRCPFGLVFDGDRLVCEWPWLVPKCANSLGVNQDTQYYYGATNGLQNYDGLGSLGLIKLGGVTGTIQQPIATIYSNADSSALGLGYQNTGGYIEGSGLSYKAAQSLQNAGLLKVNNGVVYQAGGGDYQNQEYDLQGKYESVGESAGNIQGSTLQKLSGGVAGSVNIIGGGYSAVGTLSGVDLSHNSQDGSGFITVTDSPISRVAPIPTVTAVPVPGIKTVAGFDTIRGGVIANTPELQYKVKSLKDAGLFNNFSTSYVNVVVPPSNYYQKNIIREGDISGVAVSTARPFTVTPTSQVYISSTPSYVPTTLYQQIYTKPQQTAYTYQTIAQQAVQVQSSTPKPFNLQPAIVSSYYNLGPAKSQTVDQQSTVTGYYNLEDSNAALAQQQNYAGYVYTKPTVKFEEAPKLNTYLQNSNTAAGLQSLEYGQINVTPKPNAGYVYNKPAVKFEETPVVNTYFNLQNSNQDAKSVQLQQSVVSYNAPKPETGYVYDKPSVKFEETPVVNTYFNLQNSNEVTGQQNLDYAQVQVTNRPIEVQPAVVTYYSTPQPDTGYVYEKPSVTFKETPVINTYLNLQNSNSGIKEQNVQITHVTPKPVEVQPALVTYSTPKPNVGYDYPKPVVKFEEEPVVNSYYNLQTSKAAAEKQNLEYTYSNTYNYVNPSTPKPFVVQPAVVSYSTPRPNASYVFLKPQVKIEQSPIVNSYFNLQNSQKTSDQQNYAGYTYSKPVQTYSQPQPVVTSYFNLQNSKTLADNSKFEAQGYVYTKPSIQFEETPIVSQPAVVNSYLNLQSSNKAATQYSKSEEGDYVYTQPAVKFETPVITYSTTPRPEISTEGYVYPKPTVNFEETPVRPAVVNSYFNLDTSKAVQNQVNYSYDSSYNSAKPAVVSSYYNIGTSTPKTIFLEQQSYQSPEKPVLVEQKPAVVTSYFNLYNSNAAAQQNQVKYESKYDYATPTSAKPIVKQPAVVTNYYNIGSSTQKPIVVEQPELVAYESPKVSYLPSTTAKPLLVEQQPAIVTSYFNLHSSKSTEQQNQAQYHASYNYVTPTTDEPAVVAYESPKVSYLPSSTSKPILVEQQPELVAYETPKVSYLPSKTAKPVQVDQQPAIVSSYFNLQSSKSVQQQNQDKYSYESNYNYVTPTTSEPVYESLKVSYLPSTTTKPILVQQQPAVVSSYFNLQSSKSTQQQNQDKYLYETNYNYVTPTTSEPAVVTYESPKVSYLPSITTKPILVQQQPAVVSSYFNLQSSKSTQQQNQDKYSYETNYNYVTPTTSEPAVETYESPKVSYLPSTTTKPILVQRKPAVVTSYYRQEPSKGYQYPKPAVAFEEVQEEPFVKKTAYVTGNYQANSKGSYEYAQNYQQAGKVVVENYQVPDYEKVKQVALERVQYQQPQVILNYVKTTPKPNFVSTIQTIVTKKLQPVTPASVTYYDSRYTSTPLPYVTSTPEVVVSTTSRPVSRYSFSSLDDQSQYNDIVKTSTYIPSREYLPVTTPKVSKVVEHFVAPEVTTLARDYLPIKVTIPSRAYLPITTTSEPEITTLSREYLPVKKRVKIVSTTAAPTRVYRPVTVIKTNDAHPLLSAKLGAQCTCVSNKLTLRRKQKVIVVEEEENDDDYSDYEPQRVSDDIISTTERVVKIRPPVTHVTELFYQKEKEESTPSDRDIVKAVKTGLKLVKQAAKQGAKEGTQEALSRYGQGAIDCQRAGLFRHPTQCNKFYSCRWDCTKKKFTLHVFNCPVHLTFDNSLGACNWPSQGPACVENTIITSD